MALGVRGAQIVAARADLAHRGQRLLKVIELRALAEPVEHLDLLGVQHELGEARRKPRLIQPAACIT